MFWDWINIWIWLRRTCSSTQEEQYKFANDAAESLNNEKNTNGLLTTGSLYAGDK